MLAAPGNLGTFADKSWRDHHGAHRQRRPRIKKLPFSRPSKRPIDIFEPVSNRTIIKQVHVAFHPKVKSTGRVFHAVKTERKPTGPRDRALDSTQIHKFAVVGARPKRAAEDVTRST